MMNRRWRQRIATGMTAVLVALQWGGIELPDSVPWLSGGTRFVALAATPGDAEDNRDDAIADEDILDEATSSNASRWSTEGITSTLVPLPDVQFMEGIEEIEGIETGQSEHTSQLYRRRLPDHYSLVDEGLVTPVKNQGRWNTCWSFSVVSSMESSMLKQGIGTQNTVDLSERHLADFAYRKIEDPLGNSSEDWVESKKPEDYLNTLGNCGYAGAHLARWRGLADESVAPYASDSNMPKLPDSAAYQNHVIMSDMSELDNDVEGIQNAILDYGAVAVGYISDRYYVTIKASDSDACPFVYYSSGVKLGGHAVSIVGWDNDFPKEYFNYIHDTDANGEGEYIQNDGAWLIKNSWGNQYGSQGGYFWMSYEDQTMMNFLSYQAVPADTYDHNYHYDGGGSLNQAAFPSGTSVASLFKIHGNSGGVEKLEAVNLGTWESRIAYELQVYQMEGEKTDSNVQFSIPMLKHPQEGEFTIFGLHTIQLDEPVYLQEGKTYGVVFRIFADENAALLKDENEAYDRVVSHNVMEKGDSLYRPEGEENWRDCSEEEEPYTLRIKMFTKDADIIPTTQVVLSQSEVTMKEGDFRQLAAQVLPENTTDLKQVVWSSSDPEIAKVDENGLVSATREGSTVITAMTENGVCGTCQVTVTKPEIKDPEQPKHPNRDSDDDSDDDVAYYAGRPVIAASVVNSAGIATTAFHSWQQNWFGWRCVLANGSYAADCWVPVVETGGLHYYRFDPSGYMIKGWYRDKDGRWYYLAEKTTGSENTYLPEGCMYRNATTPDGNKVGADGAWMPEGKQ